MRGCLPEILEIQAELPEHILFLPAVQRGGDRVIA